MPPIHKATADQFIKDDVNYDIVSREAIQAVHSTDALAIWVYLQSKPQTWVPRPSEIMNHFGIGRQRYLNGMKHLKEAGLVTVSRQRDEKGKISGSVIHCHSVPNHVQFNRRSAEPTVGQTDGRSNGLSIDTEISIDTESSKETDINSRFNGKPQKLPFTSFYDHYGRKEKPKDAEKAWEKLKPEEQAAAVERINDPRFKAWREERMNANPNTKYGYFPLPSSWLNAGQWEDELFTAEKKRVRYSSV